VATWENGNSYIVVASKGGVPQHPGWYRNILANPEVEVQVGTAKMKARARTAAGDERARLWERALEFWPPYADYQKKTEREIPVVVTSADITLCKEKLPCRSTKKVTFASATRKQAPASHCWSPPGAG
jgi:deazaflavin-dependent oxidoreductase (nitroreductase family)